MKRTFLALSVVALLGAAPAGAQDLGNYVVLGDSMAAGFSHLGLMDCYQERAWPALVAREAGVSDFESPLVSEPGLPALQQLVGIELGTPLGDAPILEPISDDPGLPTNAFLPRPYNNLAIPFSTTYDMVFTVGDITNLLAGNTDNVFHDLILRSPVVLGPDGLPVIDPDTGQPIPTPAIVQAIGLDPSFVTVWIGTNDVLPAVLTATPIEGVTMTPVDFFSLLYQQAVGALVTSTTADVVLVTIPDVTELPFATSVAPFITHHLLGVVPLIGSNGPLDPTSRVLASGAELIGMGYGLGALIPGAPPLPEDFDLATGQPGYVLRADETAAIKAQVAAVNQVVYDTADAFGLEVFDAGGVIDQATMGEGFTFGGFDITGEALLGGFFGYDFLHPQQLGHAILAAEFIEFLRDEFGSGITTLDMTEFLYSNPCAFPIPVPAAKAEDVVFSLESHQRLLELAMPDLKRSAPVREPARRAAPARPRDLANPR
jgi:hypothetical protein